MNEVQLYKQEQGTLGQRAVKVTERSNDDGKVNRPVVHERQGLFLPTLNL